MRVPRKKRLYMVLFMLAGTVLATTLVLFALRENLNHFYSPTEIVDGVVPLNREVRAGGLVIPGSLQRDPASLYVEFMITDTLKSVRVAYDGILPDLFKEGQGVIATGSIGEDGVMRAKTILAKHDENYMPPEVKKAIEAAGHPADKN